MFFGTFLGTTIYLKILSKVLYPIMLKIFEGIILAIRWIIKIIKLPYIKINKIVQPKMRSLKRVRRIPREAFREIKRYKKLISQKK